MHPLEKKILRIITDHRLIEPGESVVVAVSGGPDSMALMHLLASLTGHLQFNLQVTHVNHGLRVTEAAREEDLVRTEAGGLNLICETGRIDVSNYARREKLSLEHAARQLRYRFLEDSARKFKNAKIALAHTADDQAEELLLRLIRGTGRSGLAGMKMLRGGKFIRPLLDSPKKSLLAYLADRDIPFLEDSSNQEQTFLRNRVRLRLIPFLIEHFNPGLRQTLIRTAEILQDEESLLAEMTDAAFTEIKLPWTTPAGAENSGQPQELNLDLAKLGTQPRAIQRRLLETACWHMEVRPNAEQIKQLMAIGASKQNGLKAHLAKGLRVQKSGGRLTFSFPQGRNGGRGELTGPRGSVPWQIEIPEPGSYPLPGRDSTIVIDRLDQPPAFPLRAEECVEYLDLARLTFPLILRTVRPGDRFTPLGAPGSKKVNDFLSDLKIAGQERSRVTVLLSAGRIVALPGLRIDDQFRITAHTGATLAIHLLD